VCEGVWSEGVCEGVCITTSSFTSCGMSLMMPKGGGTMAWLHKCADDLQNPAATHNTTPTYSTSATPTSAVHTGPAQLT